MPLRTVVYFICFHRSFVNTDVDPCFGLLKDLPFLPYSWKWTPIPNKRKQRQNIDLFFTEPWVWEEGVPGTHLWLVSSANQSPGPRQQTHIWLECFSAQCLDKSMLESWMQNGKHWCFCFHVFVFFVVVFLLPFVCFWRFGNVPFYRLAPSGVFLMPFESYPEPFLNLIACRVIMGIQSLQGIEVFDPIECFKILRVDSKTLRF